MRTTPSTSTLALLLSAFLAAPLGAQSPVVLEPSDAQAGLNFGDAVSVDGTALLVGAPGDATVSARAYVFRSTPTGWVEEAALTAPGAAGFGRAVGVAGDLAFVGAELSVHTSGNPSGAVFVFEKSGGTWGAPTAIFPSDASSSTGFGHDVAVGPGRLLVAGDAQAYLFELVGGAWTETATFAGEATPLRDVDLHGDLVALSHSNSFVFERGPAGWDQGTPLPGKSTTIATLGQRVAVGDGRVSVLSLGGPCQFGQVHAYDRVTGQWHKHSETIDLQNGTLNGAMDGGRVAMAAGDRMLVYRVLPSGGLVLSQALVADTKGPLALHGGGDLSGNVAVLGTPKEAVVGTDSGRVWIWELDALSVLPQAVSVFSGGVQELELLRGLHDAFALYWMFGSASGTVPGLTVDGFPFPLNIDAYYVFLVLHPNTLVYPSLGILDASGRATAEIALPPLDPGLIGVTLHHAFLTFDFSAGPVVDFASNAAPLRLTTEADFVPEDFEGAALGWQFGGGELPFTTWKIVEDGVCGAVTRMAALTTNPPACGAGLQTAILNARLSSSPFRLGEVADYELRFDSILTAGIDVRVRLFVGGSPAAYFEVASTTDFDANGVLESLAFHVPGVEHAVGAEARVEFLLTGLLTGSPSGWWVDDVELVKLP